MSRETQRVNEERDFRVRDEPSAVGQWVGLLLAPAVFFVHLQVGYVLVPWACTTGGDIWVHVVGILSVLLALVGTLVAWRVHAAADNEQPNDGAGTMPRTRFLGTIGLCISAMFVLLLFAQWVAAFFISTCQ